MADLEKDFDYKDEHFDFIQQAVSTFSLFIIIIIIMIADA